MEAFTLFATAPGKLAEGAKDIAGAGTDAIKGGVGGLQGMLEGIVGESGAKYLMAFLVFIVGFFIAKIIGALVTKALSKTNIDSKIAAKAGLETSGIDKGVGMFVKYLIMLFVAMFALEIAGMKQLLTPLQDLFGSFLGAIPGIIGGSILLFIVIMIAKVIKGMVEGIMSGAKVDERLGLGTGQPVTKAASSGLFYFIILIMLPAVLGLFNLPGITEPVTDMVKKITDNIPNVIIGFVLIGIGYLVASVVQKLVYNMLLAANVNKVPAKLGFTGKLAKDGSKSPAGIIALITMITILVPVISQALGVMNLGMLSTLGESFLGGYFSLLGAVIILAIAIFVANLVHGHLKGGNALLANIAKGAILVFAGFMALNVAGISPSITDTPFMVLTIAIGFAVGVGGAIAIGLGGYPTFATWIEKKFK